jgi:hypothetical protein
MNDPQILVPTGAALALEWLMFTLADVTRRDMFTSWAQLEHADEWAAYTALVEGDPVVAALRELVYYVTAGAGSVRERMDAIEETERLTGGAPE